MHTSGKNNIAKWPVFDDIDSDVHARKMQFDLFDGRSDGEHNGVNLGVLSHILPWKVTYSSMGPGRFDRVYQMLFAWENLFILHDNIVWTSTPSHHSSRRGDLHIVLALN